MHPNPRWPDGPSIAIGIADLGLCVTHSQTPFGATTVETFGGLHGRLDAPALAARLRELRPRAALLMSRPSPAPDFESGVLLGITVGMLAALGVEVEYEAVETKRGGHVLH